MQVKANGSGTEAHEVKLEFNVTQGIEGWKTFQVIVQSMIKSVINLLTKRNGKAR